MILEANMVSFRNQFLGIGKSTQPLLSSKMVE